MVSAGPADATCFCPDGRAMAAGRLITGFSPSSSTPRRTRRGAPESEATRQTLFRPLGALTDEDVGKFCGGRLGSVLARRRQGTAHGRAGLIYAFTARITLAPPVEHGIVDGKRSRLIAITGGTVKGPRLNGVVLNGGGDWRAIGNDGVTELHARYSLKAAEGTVIRVDIPASASRAPTSSIGWRAATSSIPRCTISGPRPALP
jgi:hypothetical protein